MPLGSSPAGGGDAGRSRQPVSELKRDVPPEVRRIVSRCLKKNPAERYASGTELAQELRQCRDLLFPESGAALTPARILQKPGGRVCSCRCCCCRPRVRGQSAGW